MKEHSVPQGTQHLARTVGANIARRRRHCGMTQAELAEKLGTGADSLSRIEKGVVAPRFGRLEQIARELHCSVADLFRTPDDTLASKAEAIADLMGRLPESYHEDVILIFQNVVEMLNKKR